MTLFVTVDNFLSSTKRLFGFGERSIEQGFGFYRVTVAKYMQV